MEPKPFFKNINYRIGGLFAFFFRIKVVLNHLFIAFCVCQIFNDLPWRNPKNGSHPLRRLEGFNLVKDPRTALLKRYGKTMLKGKMLGKCSENADEHWVTIKENWEIAYSRTKAFDRWDSNISEPYVQYVAGRKTCHVFQQTVAAAPKIKQWRHARNGCQQD